MIGLDTNVMVRYLTRDDESQWQQAVKAINSVEFCLIRNVVLCKIFWVLKRKSYKYPQPEILQTMELMLHSSKLEFENRGIIYQAIAKLAEGIAQTKGGTADFADYLIGAINHENGCIHTVTFDRKLKTAKRFEVLD